MTIPANTRTYLPRLDKILLLLCKYIGKYRLVILEFLPDGSEAAVDAVLTACQALELIVAEELP